ncbi:helix-turn-helix domain-containing protein [Nakamurella endophytica]|uniref:Transcriptional regulator n=1 Tax=Nakamurella endophytica TaxID=1748367 RepID=A0A917WKJ1_9ACTN|nr:helix-turn-helix transcriptional regulator [Nakamurella endophytica]GGM10685.1 transcriptional regulator [Nakamurella endophytica]
MVRPPLTEQDRERGRALGAALRSARGERSPVEVAVAAGVSVETLRKIETGRIPTPAFGTVAVLARVVGLDLGELAELVLPAGLRPLPEPGARTA